MVQHIVMWKFRPEAQSEADEFLSKLAALEGEIECIRSMHVRRSAVENAQFDAVLVSEFDSLEDVRRYRDDPRHLVVAALCKSIRTERCSIDIEL